MSTDVQPDQQVREAERAHERELLDVAKVWRGPLAMAHVVKPLKVAQFARPPKSRGARVVTTTVVRGAR